MDSYLAHLGTACQHLWSAYKTAWSVDGASGPIDSLMAFDDKYWLNLHLGGMNSVFLGVDFE